MSGAAPDGLTARLQGHLGAFGLDVDLAIPGRGVTALVGPSGCGKTTLLRCIAGFCRLAGEVSFRGDAWQSDRSFTPPHLRRVGYVFQEASLFPHLTVRANLAYALRRAGRFGALSFDAAIELLALGHLLDRTTHRLSGGERQRVAIARALLTQPQLLLMDEPISSLDVSGKAEVLERLERLMGVLSIPVIYVSHDPAEVLRLADGVIAMKAGRVGPFAPLASGQGDDAVLGALGPAEVRRLALAALKAGLKPTLGPA